jgi:hypothetical protein
VKGRGSSGVIRRKLPEEKIVTDDRSTRNIHNRNIMALKGEFRDK